MDTRSANPQRPLSGKQLEHLFQALARAIDIVLETNTRDPEAEEEPSFKKRKAGAKECCVKGLKANLIVGINNVTRALEKLPSDATNTFSANLQVQAVIVAVDVNPRMLINHVMLLCNSRGVPILPVSRGDGCSSLRLGELLGMRTAIAIGIKEGDTAINWALQSILETQAR